MIAQIRGIPIELVNAERFYDALGIAQREMYETVSDQNVPFSTWDLPLLSEHKQPDSIWEVRT